MHPSGLFKGKLPCGTVTVANGREFSKIDVIKLFCLKDTWHMKADYKVEVLNTDIVLI